MPGISSWVTALTCHQHVIGGKLPVSISSDLITYQLPLMGPTSNPLVGPTSGCLHLKLKNYPCKIDMSFNLFPSGFSGISSVGKRCMSTSLHRFRISPFGAVLHPSQTLAVSSYSSCNCSVELQVNSPWVMHGCSACPWVANATPTSQWEIKKRLQ